MLVRFLFQAVSLSLLAMLAACGFGGGPENGPRLDSSLEKSTDPMVAGLVTSFQHSCISAAPEFPEETVQARLKANPPGLGQDMQLLAAAEEGRTCRYYVRGYGTNSATPTIGDVNALAEALHTRLGGSLRPQKPETGAGTAQVRVDGDIYNVFAYINTAGDLMISVSR